MIIRKIRMENFRGFHDKTINFEDKPVVLLTASNGMGKTTTIDAIEWCLTGDIFRLKNAFSARSTNNTERKLNSDGILKNREADDKSDVKVYLWLVKGKKEIVLCRTQRQDVLSADLSTVTLDGDKEAAEEFIKKHIGGSFYNYHFCDVQKSFSVQSKKRSEVQALFEEFITNYDSQKKVVENLKLFAEDVSCHIKEIEEEKTSPEVILNQEEQLSQMSVEADVLLYPKVRMFFGEETDILNLNKESLLSQKMKLSECGYMAAENDLSILIANEMLKDQRALLKEMISYWRKKETSIQKAIEGRQKDNQGTISILEINLERMNNMSVSKNTLFTDFELKDYCEKNQQIRKFLPDRKQRIKKGESAIEELSNEIDLLSQNNKVLKILASLSASKKEIIEYRNSTLREKGTVRCPICGAETFATINETKILNEAEKYIKRNGVEVKKKEEKKEALQERIDRLYRDTIYRIEEEIESEKGKIKARINDLKVLDNETRPFWDMVDKLQKVQQDLKVFELDIEKLKVLLDSVEGKIIESKIEAEIKAEYQNVLMLLGYDYECETMQQTHAKVKKYVTGSTKMASFSYDTLAMKLTAIESILTKQNYLALKQKVEEEKKQNDALDAKIGKLEQLKKKAMKRAESIDKAVEALSKDEYERIGPSLAKYYNKLSRIDNCDGINIVPQNHGLSIIDNKGKNIVNVLSNGQICIFLLAYFFAGINSRNKQEKMKVYFVDDLTACMDDVNMLALLDLLKYQISAKSTIEQLFFITCDKRICDLLKYKLTGHGITHLELSEKAFIEN